MLHSRDLRGAAFFLIAAFSAGCAMMPGQEQAPEPVDSEPAAEPMVVETVPSVELDEANQRISELEYDIRQYKEELSAAELKLIASNSQLAQVRERYQRLSRSHDDAVAEVVRSQARLQGNVSQADAAANIAEAEIALGVHRSEGADVAQAKALLADASSQFDEGNYGGALYLSNQSKRALANVKPNAMTLEPVEGEVRFAQLLDMWVTLNSNVRSGPGLTEIILKVLDEGTPVRAYSYVDSWVRIVLADGTEGWISQTLISQSPPLPPSDSADPP